MRYPWVTLFSIVWLAVAAAGCSGGGGGDSSSGGGLGGDPPASGGSTTTSAAGTWQGSVASVLTNGCGAIPVNFTLRLVLTQSGSTVQGQYDEGADGSGLTVSGSISGSTLTLDLDAAQACATSGSSIGSTLTCSVTSTSMTCAYSGSTCLPGCPGPATEPTTVTGGGTLPKQ